VWGLEKWEHKLVGVKGALSPQWEDTTRNPVHNVWALVTKQYIKETWNPPCVHEVLTAF